MVHVARSVGQTHHVSGATKDDAYARLYRAVRGRDLPDDVPRGVLAGIAWARGRDLARGSLTRWRLRDGGSLCFRGRRVVIRNGGYLSLGRGVVLADDVYIDAFSMKGVQLGDRVTVARGATVMGSGVVREPGVGIVVGPDTAIGIRNVVWGQGGVIIGAECLLAPHVVIVSENHGYSDVSIPIREQAPQRAEVSIGDNCWIGAGAVILAGVSIGPGSIVAAGAVVTKSFGPGSIVGGTPAKLIRFRPGWEAEDR